MRIARASRFFHANMFEPKRGPAQRKEMPAAPFPAVAVDFREELTRDFH
jgi:hypothetical protein